jgi:tRNA A-37 threonylcarbamoyl transferase component Bud32
VKSPQQTPEARASFVTAAAASVPLCADPIAWDGESTLIRELIGAAPSVKQTAAFGGPTTVVKSGPHRVVYRIDLPSGTVFLKHFKIPDWRALARNILRGSPAAREARAAAQIAQAGIETTVAAALGTTRRRLIVRDCFLVTREVTDVRPLDEIVRERLATPRSSAGTERASRFRHELARGLGQLTGRLHRHGLTHGDLHPANILAQERPDGALRLSLIDLQRVRRRRFLPLRSARHDLFGLYNAFHAIAGRSERRRFLQAWWAEVSAASGTRNDRLGTIGQLRTTARQLESYCLGALRREQIQNDRKWQRPHRRLIVADQGWQKARGLAALGVASVVKFRDDPDALFDGGNVRFWRRRSADGRSAAVDLVVAGKTLACDVRETRRPLGWRDLFFISGWSETRRAWEMGHALRRRRIGTVRPLLYLETRTLSSKREFLVAEPTDGLVTLAVFLAHRLPGLPSAEREGYIEGVLRRLATQLARMHQFSLVHEQLSSENILVGNEQDDPRVQIAAVQHVSRRRRLKPDHLVAELTPLEASVAGMADIRATHRVRFLRTCLGSRSAAEVRRIWHGVRSALTATAGVSLPPTRRVTAGKQAAGSTGKASPPAPLARIASFLVILAALVLSSSGCQTVEHPVSLPVRYSIPGDQLLVLSDFKLPKDHEFIRELNKLREQETQILELPVKRDPVIVYLFNNETEYRKYMTATYPRLPPRSAYFVGTSTELAVYTHWGQNVREDLRHEYTHGLLHSALKRVPLWLDEGLAEYFEVAGPRLGGINHDYGQRLGEAVTNGWRPDLKRLENLDDSAQMRRADYQEAWAWVHYMLHTTPEAKSVLVSYLKELRTNPHPKAISQRLRTVLPEYDTKFVSYISQLHPAAAAANVSQAAGAL